MSRYSSLSLIKNSSGYWASSFWIKGSSAEWRTPVAFQIILGFILIFGVTFLPESPRWLVKQGQHTKALAVISALDSKPISHPDVQRTYAGIHEAVSAEANAESASLSGRLGEIFTHGRGQNFRRTLLAATSQMFQQITGCNLVIYYATLLFQKLNLDDVTSRIVAACNGTEFFLASLISIFIVDRVGRRFLMMFGAAGMSLSMILLAILGAVDNSGARIASAVFLFVFNTFFGIGWLGMSWLYVSQTPSVFRNKISMLNTLITSPQKLWAYEFEHQRML